MRLSYLMGTKFWPPTIDRPTYATNGRTDVHTLQRERGAPLVGRHNVVVVSNGSVVQYYYRLWRSSDGASAYRKHVSAQSV